MLIDTSRLDRSHYEGQTLTGLVKLMDENSRPWRFDLEIKFRSWRPLEDFVAIDWGTTNSCVAYRSGGDKEGLHCLVLSEKAGQTPEIVIPSDIYFEDLSDPARPIFHVGQEALDRMTENPQCGLHSVKCLFPLDEAVKVWDEAGRSHTYPIKEVVKLLLHRLVSQAEKLAQREICCLGSTFPTKWAPRTRRRLEEVAAELSMELQARAGQEAHRHRPSSSGR